MSKRALIVTSFVGLAIAIVETLLFPQTVTTNGATNGVSIIVLVLGVLAAIAAGIALLGQRSAHRYFTIAVPLLAAISAIALSSAASSWYINLRITAKGLPDSSHTSSFIIALIVGIVLYLGAATAYGFAGQSQGVKVGARTALLVLLLLSVIPVFNVLGLIGFVITSFRRTATPAPPAASA